MGRRRLGAPKRGKLVGGGIGADLLKKILMDATPLIATALAPVATKLGSMISDKMSCSGARLAGQGSRLAGERESGGAMRLAGEKKRQRQKFVLAPNIVG